MPPDTTRADRGGDSSARPHPRPWAAGWTAPSGGPGRVATALAALALLAAAVAGALAAERPPAPLPADAPAAEFSAERAWPHLERIAGTGPTPIGSEGAADVRAHITGELRALGLDPEVQTGIGARAFGSNVSAGLAANVVAEIPGTDPTGTVLVAAHYDSTPTTPGTTDDKASVAAVLEIARALTAGPRPRNDVVLLLTDGEEPGLVGAEAFAAHHPLARGGGVMVNLEGPGNAGPSKVYDIAHGNAGVVRLLTADTPHPAGESALATGFRDMPMGFNSDRTALAEHGFTGVDTGFTDGRAYYHHPRDTVEAFNKSSLQMHGANGLALTRAAAAADLAEVRTDGDATYFSAFGVFAHYPDTLAVPLAAAGALAVAGLAALARIRRLAGVPRMLAAVAATALPFAAAAGIAVGLWELLLLIRPAYADLVSDAYRPLLYRCALGAALLAAVWAWAVPMRRLLGGVALTVGALTWSAGLGLLLALGLPSGSYLGALPALAGAAAGAAALLLRDRHPRLAAAALALGALPGAVLVTLPGAALLGMTGVSMLAPGALVLMLAGLAAVPLLTEAAPAGRRRAALAPALCGLLAVALTAGGLAVDRFDEEHPRTAHLAYLLDADAGEAMWASLDADPHPWAAGLLPDRAGPGLADLPVPGVGAVRRTGPADTADLPGPDVEVLDARSRNGGTALTVRMRPARGADRIALLSSAPVRSAVIAAEGHPDQELPPLDPAEVRDGTGTDAWAWALEFSAPPEEGLLLTLETEGEQAPRLGAAETTDGLQTAPPLDPRPAGLDVMPSMSVLTSDTVTVFRALEP